MLLGDNNSYSSSSDKCGGSSRGDSSSKPFRSSMGPNIHGWVVEVVEFMLESDGTRDAVTKSGRRCFLK